MTQENELLNLIEYWKNILNSNDINEKIKEVFKNVPTNVMQAVQTSVYPEPFYGDFESDLSDQVIILLINPGSLDNENDFALRNNLIKERITKWDESDYLKQNHLDNELLTKRKKDLSNEENMKLGSIKWRSKMINQVNKIMDESYEFLYTMEFFPFHSKSWKSLKTKEMEIILQQEFMIRTINALKYISNNKKAKGILAVGRLWVDLLETAEFSFNKETGFKELKKNNSSRPSHRLWKFTNNENSTPIIVYSSCSMNLPSDSEPVSIIQKWLNE